MSESDSAPEHPDISADDVVFECPYCGKSLAIDRRAAGMAIACPDCDEEVVVPPTSQLPGEERVEMTPDQRIDSMSNALQESHADIRRLSSHVSEVTKRRKYLEHLRASNMKRMELVAEELTVIQSAIDRIASILQESTSDDLPKM